MKNHKRLATEYAQLVNDPPPGIACWLSSTPSNASMSSAKQDGSSNNEKEAMNNNNMVAEERLDAMSACIIGPEESPYEGGAFMVDISIPDRYPFEPPHMKFSTKIYHPNIDSSGRICLDSLKMPPKGSWQPSLNISQLLSQIRLLMSEPNPDDPLMPEISDMYKNNKSKYVQIAKEWTKQYASQSGDTLKKYTPIQQDVKKTQLNQSSSSSSSKTSTNQKNKKNDNDESSEEDDDDDDDEDDNDSEGEESDQSTSYSKKLKT